MANVAAVAAGYVVRRKCCFAGEGAQASINTNVFLNAGPHPTTPTREHVWGTFYRGHHCNNALWFEQYSSFLLLSDAQGHGITFNKLAVLWLWILDALHLFLIVHCIYYYLVTNYANISALTIIVWSFKLQFIIDVLIVYGVHVLYVYRIWLFAKGRSRALPITVGIIVILASGVAISMIWAVYQCRMFSDLVKVEWSSFLTLGTVTFVDIVIASTLCYLLATSRTGFSNTDSIITKLMAYIINTGCLTSICSMTAVITCAAMPNDFIFLGIEFLLASLYVNSFLALLNARSYSQSTIVTNNNSSEVHVRHAVYRPELNIKASQDEESQGSRKNMFKHSVDEVVHITPSAMPHRPIEVTVETNSFSSV
ncbi:hypothetical protein DEU56DRAFT_978269 [Suillus clintonianus]|uniref:uncharacterized protein n=1 Tax=Suillus clintonianus TaxID=1904413 RepID=UPI001B8793CE|nr:uncharacterized protein DEU56DRAFT_978269 [Suillus clintonianus]KAG2148020.1 hypothetical protein DEU56DRAFT_978269 [Suillus clintonianus]